MYRFHGSAAAMYRFHGSAAAMYRFHGSAAAMYLRRPWARGSVPPCMETGHGLHARPLPTPLNGLHDLRLKPRPEETEPRKIGKDQSAEVKMN
jgi:hypothetical protein